MANEFAALQTTAPEASVKLQLVREMVRFVRLGLKDPLNPKPQASLITVASAVQAGFVDSLVAGQGSAAGDGSVCSHILESFFDEYDSNCRLYYKELVPPVTLTLWKEEAELVVRRYGTLVTRLDVQATVEGALKIAWANLRRAQQRWAIWLVLGSLFQKTPEGQRAETEAARSYEVVSRALLADLETMTKRMLMFALVVGGAEAEEAKHWVLRTSLGEGMALVEMLTYDGALPLKWLRTSEAELRDSIKHATMRVDHGK